MLMIFLWGKWIIIYISTFNNLAQNIQLKFNNTFTHMTILVLIIATKITLQLQHLAIKYMYVVFHKKENNMFIQNSFSINYIIYILNYTLVVIASKFIFVTFGIAFTMNYIIHSNLRLLTIRHHVATHFLNFWFPNQ